MTTSVKKVVVPNSGYPDETFNVTLNSVAYTCRFQFNFRFGFWFFTLKQGATLLFDNVKVTQGVNVGEIYNAETGLTGIFYVTSISGDLADPSENDFGQGKDKQLVYQYEVSS